MTAEKVAAEQWAGLDPALREGELYLLHGDSMFPILRAGDLLLFQEMPVEPGDIVAYRREGEAQALVHRVLDCAAPGPFPYVVKGDNCFAADAVDEECRLIGRLHYVWRGGQRIDFEHPLRRLWARALAKASRRNLLPELVKKRLSETLGDWLREVPLVVNGTAFLVREDLQVHHFPPREGESSGHFILRRGEYPVGELAYDTRPGREGGEALVRASWLRFPFSYGLIFSHLLEEAEGAWRSQNLRRAVFPFSLCRKAVRQALERRGYALEEAGGAAHWAKFL